MNALTVGDLPDLAEDEDERAWRRFRLAAVDRLLTAIEEFNVAHGGEEFVTVRLWRWYQILSGDESPYMPTTITGATLMDCALHLQTRLLRTPVVDPAVSPLRRRRRGARPTP